MNPPEPLLSAYTSAKQALSRVPPVWLVVISGGLCALTTLGLAGLAGIPGNGQMVNLEAGQQAITISSKSLGSLLEVSLDDGLLRAGAKDPNGLASRFLLVPLTEATVLSLRVAATATAKLALQWDAIQTTTRSGCNCTGFSNEHGFGRYCHSWELSYQDAWCYIDESCPGGKKGSYGRRHEVCTPEPPPPPKDEYNYSATFKNEHKEEYVGHWQAPSGCSCSGFSSKLGYGASCKAWEEKISPHQTPWCYVHDNCTIAERKRGSFGKKHTDCVYEYTDSKGETPKPMPQGPIKPKKAAMLPAEKHSAVKPLAEEAAGFFSKIFGRRLAQPDDLAVAEASAEVETVAVLEPTAEEVGRVLQQEYPVTRAGRKKERQAIKSSEHVAEEAALLRRVAMARPRWVALVSAVTHGFVTIEAPPHKNALLVHAKSPQLSLNSAFALLPTGAIMAAGTNALLTLCDPNDKQPTACSGFKPNPSDPHRKLLRSEASSKHATFELKAVSSH